MISIPKVLFSLVVVVSEAGRDVKGAAGRLATVGRHTCDIGIGEVCGIGKDHSHMGQI